VQRRRAIALQGYINRYVRERTQAGLDSGRTAARLLLAICDCFPRYVLKPEPDDIFCGSPPLAFTYGLGGLQKLLLGSVAEKVLHRLKVPLLALSPKSIDRKADASSRPKTILMALDLREDSTAVIRHAVWLAEHYRAKLVAAHAVPIPAMVVDDRSLQMVPVEELVSLEASLVEERRRELRAILPAMETDVEIVVTLGGPFEVLRTLARERSADLVVMGSGGHGAAGLVWLGSTSHKMVRSAECPVLIAR